jgi:hypothetical protein
MISRVQLAVGCIASAMAGSILTLGVASWKDSGNEESERGVVAITLIEEPNALPVGMGASGEEFDIDDPRISFRQLKGLATRMAMADPVLAVEAAATIPGYDNREAYFGMVLRTWGEMEGEKAASWSAEYFEGQQLTDALYYVADGWAEADPEGAAEWFTENTEGVIFEDAVWEALEAWGRKDPEKAFAWTANLDEYQRESVMDGLAEGWGAVDPEAAIEAGMKMLDTEYGYDFVISGMTQWAGSDPIAAAAWGEAILNEGLREGVLMELGERWSLLDPLAASEWVQGIDDPGTRRFAESGVAVGWSEHDPGGALEWALQSSSEEAQREDMIGDIMFNWTNLDPRGAVEWLQTRPPGDGTDMVLEILSGSLITANPRAAVAWAGEMSNSSKREEHLRLLLKEWVDFEGQSALGEIREMDGIPANLVEDLSRKDDS